MRAQGSSPDAPGARDPDPDGNALRPILGLAPFLAGFWLILSGHYTPLLLSLGAASVVLVAWLTWRTGLDQYLDVRPLVAVRLPRFALWLGGQVLLSALVVTRKVWSPRPDLRPVVEDTPTHGLTDEACVIYANAITLTPGTLSLSVDEDRIVVHSLDPKGVEELGQGAMLSRVRRSETRR